MFLCRLLDLKEDEAGEYSVLSCELQELLVGNIAYRVFLDHLLCAALIVVAYDELWLNDEAGRDERVKAYSHWNLDHSKVGGCKVDGGVGMHLCEAADHDRGRKLEHL